MKIIRVFPRRTNMTPIDDMVFFGEPGLFRPEADEIHISTVFTWDIPKAEYLKKCWEVYYPVVKVGGPAYGDPGGEFVPGKYIKQGVTITSRGCPNKCNFCLVPEREGKLKEIQIHPGNIIQDNNLLACSKTHIDKVFEMLSYQKRIDFNGGFESSRVTGEIAEKLRDLKIYQMWLAYDHPNSEKPLKRAVKILSKYFNRDKIRCYVLIGYKNDTLEKAEARLRTAWEYGTLPFAMRYRQPINEWPPFLYTDRKWNLLQRKWSRPAIIKSIMRGEKNANIFMGQGVEYLGII